MISSELAPEQVHFPLDPRDAAVYIRDDPRGLKLNPRGERAGYQEIIQEQSTQPRSASSFGQFPLGCHGRSESVGPSQANFSLSSARACRTTSNTACGPRLTLSSGSVHATSILTVLPHHIMHLLSRPPTLDLLWGQERTQFPLPCDQRRGSRNARRYRRGHQHRSAHVAAGIRSPR